MIAEKLLDEGIRLRSWGPGDQQTTCPKCSHTRKKKTAPCLSVTVEADGAVWNCHHCDFKGGVSTKLRENDSGYTPRPKPTVVRPKQVQGKKTLDAKVIAWFQTRGISEEVLKRNKITSRMRRMPASKEPVITIEFPFFKNGELYNVKYRSLDKQFMQSKGAEKIFFGLDDIKGRDEVIICEGEMDKLSFEEAGFVNVISVPDGAPAKLKDQTPKPEDDTKFNYIWNCKDELEGKKIIIAVDNDEPGRVLAEELARRFGKERCSRVKWTGDCKDANDVLVNKGFGEIVSCVGNAEMWPIKGLYKPLDFLDEILDYYDNGEAQGLSTGWKSLDNYLTIRGGELTVVTGIPNSGKSEFLDALMVNMANQHNWSFAIFSPENQAKNHMPKFLEKHTGKTFFKHKGGSMSKDEVREGMNWVSTHFNLIVAEDDGELPTIDWILDRAKTAVMRYGIKGLVIDPYNEIEQNRPAGQTETDYVSFMLSKVKRFARNHDVHVWFVAHPAKIQTTKGEAIPVPGLYSISGSANWANKPDIGITVHRSNPEDLYGQTEIHIQKMRFKEVGKRGMVKLRYNSTSGRYSG